MHRLREVVKGADALQLIVMLPEIFYIPGEGRRIAADIDEALRRHGDDSFQASLVAALSGRVHADKVDPLPRVLRMPARQELFRCPGEERCIFNAIPLCIFPGIPDGIRNDFNPVDSSRGG